MAPLYLQTQGQEAWRPWALGPLPATYSLHSCIPVKSECLELPKYIPLTLASTSYCFISTFVKILPFKILPSSRWTFQVLQPPGMAPLGKFLALCLSVTYSLSVVELHYDTYASSALLPSHRTAGALSTGLGRPCPYQARQSPGTKWGPACHPHPTIFHLSSLRVRPGDCRVYTTSSSIFLLPTH